MINIFMKQFLSSALSVLLLIGIVPLEVTAQTGQQGYSGQGVPLTGDELQQLVAPIALYPDSLVAQVLAAATYPDQVAAAAGWLKQYSLVSGPVLMQVVDVQPWDPAVKALTQFPSVLNNLAANLTWTSSLGEAYHTQAADVMTAVQVLRAKALAAGNLKSGAQLAVVQQSPQVIVIQPVNPQVVYVPMYNPAVVYGYPYVVPAYVYVPPPWRCNCGLWSRRCGRGHDGRRLLRVGIQQLELRMARQHNRGLSRRRVLRKQRMARRILRL
jgi:Protein of unknown function (DUF3300)